MRIDERIDGGLPALDEVRDKVLNDYRFDQREKLNQALLDELLGKYDVVFDEDLDQASKPGGQEAEDGES